MAGMRSRQVIHVDAVSTAGPSGVSLIVADHGHRTGDDGLQPSIAIFS
jgi:hypothetical protein